MRTSRQSRFRALLFLGVGIVLTGLVAVAYVTEAFRSLELNTVDTRFSIRGKEKPPPNLVVVGVDPKTFQVFGDERWPFTHDLHAAVVDRLRRDGAKVIAIDLQFSEPSNTDEETLALVDAVERAGNVVLSTTEVDDLGNGHAFEYIVPKSVLDSRKPHAVNDFIRRDVRAEVAYGGFPNDPGGVLRRVSYDTDGLKSFSIAAAEKATGHRIDPAALGDSAWIDYYGPPRTIRHVSYSDVRLGKTKPGFFRGKIVVIGATEPVLQDVHPTSTSGDDQMAGPEIQAQAIGTALRGYPLKESSTGLDVALIVLLGLVAPAASLGLSALRALALALLLGGAYVVVTQLVFNGGTILPFVYPLGALALSAVGALGVHYTTEAFERARVRDMFSRFVPENVVDDVIARADGLRLGGVQREGTVMFSDLRGFTSFAESLPPDRVIEILNRYLTEMSNAILDHGGTLVAYMGDGIMAVFGAPVPQDDHADRALAAAREMLGPRLRAFNDHLRSEGLGQGFRMGIGLNSGRVMSGNVGSERRVEYTAIGDTTNTASRIEGMTKGTPHQLFLADSTREMLRDRPDDLLFVDEFEVRGRQAKVKLWSLADDGRGGSGAGSPAPAGAGAP